MKDLRKDLSCEMKDLIKMRTWSDFVSNAHKTQTITLWQWRLEMMRYIIKITLLLNKNLLITVAMIVE